MTSDTHVFAIYCEKISHNEQTLQEETPHTIHNESLWTRIVKVLRLKPNDRIILFNNQRNVSMVLDEKTFTKKYEISGAISSINKNKQLHPELTLFQCITQKNTFEDVCYTAAQMGMTKIVPVISEKSSHKWFNEKSKTRLNKVLISACEQSKNFILPTLQQPTRLTDVSSLAEQNNISQKIYFDVVGKPLSVLLEKFKTQDLGQPKKLAILIGPEGGLCDFEKQLLNSNNFECYSLTPTILRTKDAVVVGLGCLRSIVK